jgi:hypothetical protein
MFHKEEKMLDGLYRYPYTVRYVPDNVLSWGGKLRNTSRNIKSYRQEKTNVSQSVFRIRICLIRIQALSKIQKNNF